MADSNTRRSDVRNQIRKTSREEFILSEMKRLGYWPDDKDKPTVAEELIKRRRQLSKEISNLSRLDKQFENKEAVLNRFRKERMRLSRERQKLNKQKRIDEKLVKENAKKVALAKDIEYLGNQFSYQLQFKDCDEKLLTKNNLPSVKSVLELSKILGIAVKELRFLSYHRKLNKKSHYIRYGIKKKSGGIRKISAPMPRLKTVQTAILNQLLDHVPVSDFANGFVKSKSIITNAKPHVGADVVVNMDFKNFFPTIDYKRVFGLFKGLGFSPQIATVLSLICTEPDEDKVKVRGEILYINKGERFLPQGAPTSPMLTNIICRRMDARMSGVANQLGFTYTRYADDMTFSGSESARKNIKKLMWQSKAVVKDEDFVLHPDKTKVMCKGMQKEVTGIIVNEKVNIAKKKMKAFRALLFQIEKDGLDGKTWGESPDVLSSIEGFARYVYMVDPVKGKKYLNQVDRILSVHRPKKKKSFFKKKPETGKKPWWKIW